MSRRKLFLRTLFLVAGSCTAAFPGPEQPANGSPAAPPGKTATQRIGAAQPRSRLIDHHVADPSEVLSRIDRLLEELESFVSKAGASRCDVVAFPEDTLGLGRWEAGNKTRLKEVLPEAVKRMLDRLGRAAAAHHMYLVCSSDTIEPDGALRNTAFLLGRDGKEIGRYHKVNLPIHELQKRRGNGFPVFETPDLGAVGLLICYDMVFPEAPRCLALAGADIIFHPTLGGAAIGDDDLSRAAFRTRAVENFVYIVVAQRGGGSMIISPQGKILAEGKEPDEIVIADVDVSAGREGGDAMNFQHDMRSRLFRERSPEAFGLLTDPRPPVLAKVPATITIEDAVRVADGALTAGEERFKAADALLRDGKADEAEAAFEKLRADFPQTWIDRVAAERLEKIGAKRGKGGIDFLETRPDPPGAESPPEEAPRKKDPGPSSEASQPSQPPGIAASHPGDTGIKDDPRVLFAESFEVGSLDEVAKRWSEVSNKDKKVLELVDGAPPGSPGKRCLQITAMLNENTGGHLYVRLPRGVETCYARFYVKFEEDPGYIHHFVNLGGFNPPTAWPQGGAGERPRGDDRVTVGIEPTGDGGRYPAPGIWNFYTYWQDMKISADGRHWGNSLKPAEPALVPRGKWQCVELMLKLNSAPEKHDGELALWLDGSRALEIKKGASRTRWTGMGFSLAGKNKAAGKDVEPFEGFRWRSTNDLKVNFFWLSHYVTENAARQNKVANPPRLNRVWFDDVVVATGYVGPIAR